MTFDTITRGVWTFNKTLTDEYQGQDFSTSGKSPIYTRFQLFDLLSGRNETRYGIEFDDDTTLSSSMNGSFLGSTYRLSAAFWWFSPAALGTTKHTITKKTTPMIAPIVAKSDTSINSDIEIVDSGQGEWIISEIGVTEKQNAIRLYMFSNGTSVSHVFDSIPYLPGLHHIYVAYDGSTNDFGEVRLFVDGQPSPKYFGPEALLNTTAKVRINNCGFGYTAHKTKQTSAILGDLVLRAFGLSSTSQDAITMLRFGWQHITQNDLFETNYTFNGMAYTQPSVVTTNQVLVEGGNIFAARSNGELVKGYRPIWDREENYKTPESLQFIGRVSSQSGIPEGAGGILPPDPRVIFPGGPVQYDPNRGLILNGVTIKI